ncbi:YihY/virulence factor BrkB family protein [Flavobacterium litorale]|uniref:YihY/virulence factor BrkB family protein n=1 Tax=Flavobacterium litorale TaxID=2856519 RepID=A0ABX8VDM6_9FLAO|nr:YihY/virulence factor BrkB family protein [Flavobacterium litorale]QYJ68741.1 YihY/virulence factor BrkB family protein [Flavobacterium litorale]
MDAKNATFKISHLPSLLVETYKVWSKDDPYRLSAVIAYYAVLSLPGLLVIIINLVGLVWGHEIVQGQLTDEISSALGRNASESIQAMMVETQNEDKSTLATILGIGVLIFGATGVFYHLQLSLNQIWEIKPKPDSGFIKTIIDRARSFVFIIVIGFLLLISFIITAGISALNSYIKSILPDAIVYIAFVFDFVISIGIVTVLFALIFKYLPDVKIRWKSVWVGAIITSVLFTLGKFLLGYYFGESNPGSTYGAAGTVVLILLWVSYSCLILFFGAEFTWVYSKRYGSGIHSKYEEIDKAEGQ